MDIILVIMIVLLGVFVVNTISNINENVEQINELKAQVKKECKLHDWVTDEKTNKMMCCQCGKFAGIIESDYE